MPGRASAEAFRAFIDPIQQDLSCIVHAKITTSARGMEVGKVHVRSINREQGLAMPDGYHFDALMNYEVIRTEDRAYRVTTHSYLYSLRRHGEEVFAMHWHPAGHSDYEHPHMHLNLPGGVDYDTSKAHLPVGRLTFEDAVEWVINVTAAPAREDWMDVLESNRALHVTHRSWHTRPIS